MARPMAVRPVRTANSDARPNMGRGRSKHICCRHADRFSRRVHLPWTDGCAHCHHWDCMLTRLHLLLTGEPPAPANPVEAAPDTSWVRFDDDSGREQR